MLHKLSLNTQNTFYFLFHRTKIKGNNSVVKINDCVLSRVNNIKYIGVFIDHKFKWCEHILYVKNKYPRVVIFKAITVLEENVYLSFIHLFIST